MAGQARRIAAKATLIALLGTTGLTGSLYTGPAGAAEVYRWTDADGVVHFSDRPPATAQSSLTTMTVNDQSPTAYDPGEDLYNLEATAARTQSLRDEHARARESRSARTAAAPAAVQSAQPQAYGVDYGNLPGYDRPGVRPPQRPDRPARPKPQPLPTDTVRPARRSRN
jgi:hypothetical protein